MRIDILMYADDIILIATFINDAQTMLDVVSEFSNTHQVKFNPDKTGLLIFKDVSDTETTTRLLLCGEPIVIEKILNCQFSFLPCNSNDFDTIQDNNGYISYGFRNKT